MRWAAVVPLVGGQLLGTEKVMGVPPAQIASYAAFAENDQYSFRRWSGAERVMLDEGQHIANELDMIVSVCPCAGLSTMTASSQEAKDSRNDWMFKTAEYVLGRAKPRVYFGENAPGLFTGVGRDVVKGLAAIAAKNDYGMTLVRLNSVDCGNPQDRLRTFYYFWKGAGSPIVEVERSPQVSAAEYMARLPRTAPGMNDEPITNVPSDPAYLFLHSKFGKKWREGGGDERVYKNSNEIIRGHDLTQEFLDFCDTKGITVDNAQRRNIQRIVSGDDRIWATPLMFDRRGVYPAMINRYSRGFVHPTEDRGLNVRELAWLMGHPADYELPPKGKYNILSQNVTAESAATATRIAYRYLIGETPPTGDTFAKFDSTLGTGTVRVV